MSTATAKVDRGAVQLQRQIARGKSVLRELRETLEDLEDRLELARAKKRNQGKPGVPWEQARRDLGLDF